MKIWSVVLRKVANTQTNKRRVEHNALGGGDYIYLHLVLLLSICLQ